RLPLTGPAHVSGPLILSSAWQQSPPEPPLLPSATLFRSGWLYQPLLSATRLAVADTTGLTESYLKLSDALAVLPALSVQLPLTEPAAVCGPLTLSSAWQESTPEPPVSVAE